MQFHPTGGSFSLTREKFTAAPCPSHPHALLLRARGDVVEKVQIDGTFALSMGRTFYVRTCENQETAWFISELAPMTFFRRGIQVEKDEYISMVNLNRKKYIEKIVFSI